MQKHVKRTRYLVIGILLLLAVVWSLASAGRGNAGGEYPRSELLASAEWLHEHAGDPDMVILDVRTDDHFDGKLIPGAVRLPWSAFRYDSRSSNIGELFVGPERAQEILGENGIGRTDTIVLYDSVKRDGGATASYVFWVLDVLGHEKKRILEGGIDAWERAGFGVESTPKTLQKILYQAPTDAVKRDRWVDGRFVSQRLGDPFYQILDVRSREEYLGQKGSKDLHGNPLKLGHIPTAVNIEYKQTWVDEETKMIKPYSELQELYRGLDPERGVIVYCDSGRRGSFSYFVLRLMGFAHVSAYEASWKEWGHPALFFPVETLERTLAGEALPGASAGRASGTVIRADEESKAASEPAGEPQGGYVSCGG